MTSLFSLFYVTGECYRFLHRGFALINYFYIVLCSSGTQPWTLGTTQEIRNEKDWPKLLRVNMASGRTRPNILVTGTPGTGKTVTASTLAERTGLNYINVGELAKEKHLYEGWDDQYECHVLDEDKASKLSLIICS